MLEDERNELDKRAAAIVHPDTPVTFKEWPTSWHSGYEDGFLGLRGATFTGDAQEIAAAYSDGYRAGRSAAGRIGGDANETQIREYIEQFKGSILVRVRLGCEWRDLSIEALRALDPAEAVRVESRLVERCCLPHRVDVI